MASTNAALERARAKRQAMAEAGIKVTVKTPLQKLAENPRSLRLAVNAMCYQCEGENADPGVKWRIGNCECRGCALHAVRPYQNLAGKPAPVAIRPAQ